MDRKPSNPETDSWVDERLASLAPSSEWTPNAHRALNQILKGQNAAGPRWMRLGMTATILATTVVVLALLPWQRLWTPERGQKSVTAAAMQQEKQQTEPQTPTTPEPAEQPSAEPSPKTVEPVVSSPEAQNLRLSQDEYIEFMNRYNAKGRTELEQAEEVKRTQAELIAAGAGQSSGVTPPKVVSQILPEYTEEAKQSKIVGSVELIVIIRADGSVQFERVKSGLGYGLDEKAREAVEKWHFTPATKDGMPVATMISINVNFTLR